MVPNAEKLVGIAVNINLSADASIAMDGWLNGMMRSVFGKDNKLRHDNDRDVMFYWSPLHDFTLLDLDGLTEYLERYFEEDDPRPYLCDMQRTQQYYYVGEHIGGDRKPLKIPENLKEARA